MPELIWLPHKSDWPAQASLASRGCAWTDLIALANARLGFAETIRLDKILQKQFPSAPDGLTLPEVKLALLGSATTDHLLPSLRVGALRRGLYVSAATTAYGQYFQELSDTQSALHSFRPDIVLFAFDVAHILTGRTIDEACRHLRSLWAKAREHFGATIFQQAFLHSTPPLLGNNEHRLETSPSYLTTQLNQNLRSMVEAEGIHLVAVDERARLDGLQAWHDPIDWYRAKQDVRPLAAPLYGDLVARMIAALHGRSSKCLVLDLDNTLWGGVIGDDGLDGIKLGQGSASGEAHQALQRYAHDLARRGVILAVCSKNDEANAVEAFDKHPEMVLKRSDIACFIANWDDKPTNLRRIADRLNIGLDALVLLDDQPFERNNVRRALPMVGVPELPEDPASYAETLAAGGYFEALHITEEDRARSVQYQANRRREELKASAGDLDAYLESLDMRLEWRHFQRIDLHRLVQLIGKTNQFNLTTRRYTAAAIEAFMQDPKVFTAALRLTDQFGDNGLIAAVIAKDDGKSGLLLDSWLMSCRVLGRGVEAATLNIIATQAIARGYKRLIGHYIATPKNGVVKDHYAKLGFTAHQGGWVLPLNDYTPRTAPIAVTHQPDTHQTPTKAPL
ncbi:MAG: HAD-IIIC family phosphatase [Pseudomonadota bacterium]|nr:HAD-IIIC family phosphatase [Pseudomonadota bacterium]